MPTKATHYAYVVGKRFTTEPRAAAAKDGSVLWKAKRKGSTAVIPTPIYKNNHVLVSSGYGVG